MLSSTQLIPRQLLQLQQTCSSVLAVLLQGGHFNSAARSPLFPFLTDSRLYCSSDFDAQQGCKETWQPTAGHISSRIIPSTHGLTTIIVAAQQPSVARLQQYHGPTQLQQQQQQQQKQQQQHQHQHQRWQQPQPDGISTCWHSSSSSWWPSNKNQQHHAINSSKRHWWAASKLPDTSGLQCSASVVAAAAAVSRPFHSTSSSASVLSGDSSSSSSSSPTWVDRYLPQQLHPYAHLMRLDKPIGSWLLAWPGLWTIALAAEPGHLPDLWLSSLFAAGAVLMRGAGCTVNDLWDQDIDKKVARTRTRPLAAGAISQNAAISFLIAQLLASFMILLQLNTYTQILGWCSLALVGTYPLMKRITWWPQAFLGLCMNYGVLMGYSAAHGSCDWSVVLPMYAAGVSWTLVYDTIYAHQDKKDDAQIGVKSTALLFGDRTKSWASGFAILQTLGLIAAGSAAGLGVPYYAAVAAGAGHQAWQIGTVDLNNGPDCMAKFVSNKWYGGLLYAGLVLDKLLAVVA